MCTKAAYSRIHTAFLDLADGPLHLFPVRPPEGIMSYCQILLEKIGTAPLRATAVPLHIRGDTAPKAACCLRQREWHLTCIWVSKEYTGTGCFWRLYIMISTPQYSREWPTRCSTVNRYKANQSRCLLSCSLAGISSHTKSHHCFEEVLFICIPGIL